MTPNAADIYELKMRLQVAEHCASWASDLRAMLANIPHHHPAAGGIVAAIAATEKVLSSLGAPLGS